MAAMLDISLLLTLARFGLVAYAAAATTLATACLALHVVGALERGVLRRRLSHQPAGRGTGRPLFVRLEPEAGAARNPRET